MERVSDEKLAKAIEDVVTGAWSVFPVTDAEVLLMARELQELRSQSRWVKVSERLPEDDPFVLVFVSNADGKLDPQFAVAYRYEGNWMGELDEYADDCVTHWMELPAAPKEGENGQK